MRELLPDVRIHAAGALLAATAALLGANLIFTLRQRREAEPRTA